MAGLGLTVSAARQRSAGSAFKGGAFALVGGTLINGTGSRPVRNSVVLIRGERIERLGTMESLSVPAGYEQISTEGMTVLPGLWDLLVHLLRHMDVLREARIVVKHGRRYK